VRLKQQHVFINHTENAIGSEESKSKHLKYILQTITSFWPVESFK